MSSHVHRSGRSRRSSAPWVVVATLIVAAAAFGGALILGSGLLVVIGAVLVIGGLVASVVLTRRGQAPVSFAQEFPATTLGPRATVDGHSGPPIDTQPNGPPAPPARGLDEIEAGAVPEPPDDQRVFPQLSNLSPDERLRNVGGREVIERAESPENEEGSSPDR